MIKNNQLATTSSLLCKAIQKIIPSFLLAFLILSLLAACSGGGGGGQGTNSTTNTAAPVFKSIGTTRTLNSNVFVQGGDFLELDVGAEDADGDPISYAVFNRPAWLSFDQDTAIHQTRCQSQLPGNHDALLC